MLYECLETTPVMSTLFQTIATKKGQILQCENLSLVYAHRVFGPNLNVCVCVCVFLGSKYNIIYRLQFNGANACRFGCVLCAQTILGAKLLLGEH